jgi:hypothetical protein
LRHAIVGSAQGIWDDALMAIAQRRKSKKKGTDLL